MSADDENEQAAQIAILAISTAPNTTQAWVALLRAGAERTGIGMLDHAANSISGNLGSGRPKVHNDIDALIRIRRLIADGIGEKAIAAIAKEKYPKQPREQEAARKRYHRALERDRT